MTAEEIEQRLNSAYPNALGNRVVAKMLSIEIKESFKAKVEGITDEEIERKAKELSYVFRDDDDFKRSDSVETYSAELGYWLKQKLLNE